jgi:glyoxylase I family protein
VGTAHQLGFRHNLSYKQLRLPTYLLPITHYPSPSPKQLIYHERIGVPAICFLKTCQNIAMIATRSVSTLPTGALRRIHHIALNVGDMQASRHFYGTILGLHELAGTEIPSSLIELVAQGRVANFRTPDGTVLDLFGEPDLSPPSSDPTQQFTRANHLAFDIAPELFELAVAVLRDNGVKIDGEPVTRSTGRGVYCYDPDGFIVEIRCD